MIHSAPHCLFPLQPFQNVWLMRFCNSLPLFSCAYTVINYINLIIVLLPQKLSSGYLCCCQTLVVKPSSLKNIFLHQHELHMPTAYPLLKETLACFRRCNINISQFNFNYNGKRFPVVSGNLNITEQRFN